MNGKEKSGTSRKRASWERYVLAVLTVCAGVGLSVAGFAVVRGWERYEIETDFASLASERSSALKKVIDAQQLALVAIRGFYDGSRLVKRHEFKAFVEPLFSHAGSIQALEWVPRVRDTERAEYEAAARQDTFEDFQITERDTRGRMVRATRRDEYYPAYFVQPRRGNRVATGFDFASDPRYSEALRQARDTGEAAATRRIPLDRQMPARFGAAVFLPVYAKGPSLKTVEDRRSRIEGVVFGSLQLALIMEPHITRTHRKGIEFHVYDNSAPEGQQFLYFHPH